MLGRDLMPQGEGDPLFPLQKEMNRLFDAFTRGFFDGGPLSEERGWMRDFSPTIDVKDTEKSIVLTAELPGMDEKDVEVSLTKESLVIKGEKKSDKEEKGKGYFRQERRFGSFQRVMPLPPTVDTGKAEAAFKKGVLTITLPKKPEAQVEVKKLNIKKEE